MVDLAHLLNITVAEAQPDAETGQQLQQATVFRQQLSKLSVF